ncbi:MAG TPA: two-component regulator propeller domain-containing protein [Pyrinomonadaceae bacterium]
MNLTQRPAGPHLVPSRLLLICILLACSPSVFALDPSLDVSQYAHTAWKIRDGFAKGAINSIAQTPDGYLWLGTEFGLLRFDGIKAVPWEPPGGQTLPSKEIFSLLGAKDGTLWIGTTKGLASWKNGKLTQYGELANHYIFKVIEDHEGTIWASGLTVTVGKLCAIRTGTVECHGDDGTLGRGAFNIYEDSKGNLWAGVKNGIWHWRPGPPKFYSLEGELDGIQGMGEDVDGTLLVGWNGGIHRFVDGKPQPYQLAHDTPSVNARRILRDRDGGLWLGTGLHGLTHIHQGRMDSYTVSNGLSAEGVYTLFEDREGDIWVATRSGLDRFRDYTAATFSMDQGLSNNIVHSVLAARDGSVWLATADGLNQWNNGQIRAIAAGSGKDFSPSSLFQDESGRIWIATPSEVGYLEKDRFISVTSVQGAVLGITQDTTGNVWVANEHAGLFQLTQGRVVQQIPWANLGHKDHVSVLANDRRKGGVWLGFFLGGVAYFEDGQIKSSYTASEGLTTGRVSDFFFDQNNALWIATQGGLSRLKDDRLVALTSKNGLPCDAVHWLREDDDHSFWLYTPCGLIRVAATELNALAGDVEHDVTAKRTLATTVFDSSEGVRTLAASAHFRPQITKSTDGRFWFTGDDGLRMIDPRNLHLNKLPPPVHIEQVIADRQTYDAVLAENGRLSLPPLIRDLQIDYTALSLVAPEKTRFRYRLENHDGDWQEAGDRRQAFYNNLPPGNYRFRVMACNNSGVWNETGAYLDFVIQPAYYQTIWFRFLVVAALLLLLGTLYQLRVRQIAGQVRARMEERLEERERIARDLHDTLLQSVQGLILKFDAAAKQIPRELPAHTTLQKTLDRADEVLAEGRDRVRNLRSHSIPAGGLPAAFQHVVEESGLDRKATFKTVVEGGVRELHPMVCEEAYSIGREALINALTHSSALNIEVEMGYGPRQFRLRIRDDGRGFDPAILEKGRPDHWGLKGMRERADHIGAELKIWSGHQTGTEIELSVPAPTAYQTQHEKSKSLLGRFIGKFWQ